MFPVDVKSFTNSTGLSPSNIKVCFELEDGQETIPESHREVFVTDYLQNTVTSWPTL